MRVRMVSFGKDESDIHILSDEDTESVHRMVVAIFVSVVSIFVSYVDNLPFRFLPHRESPFRF